MKISSVIAARFVILVVASVFVSGCERPSPVTHQEGYRGTGMVDVQNARRLADEEAANIAPASAPPAPAGGPPAGTVFKNVHVLQSISVPQMTSLMVAMTNWVSPVEGCAYCHNPADMASDEKYTKVVARRMLQMTQNINSNWKTHVAETGVTCYTCHRGKPVPSDIWFQHPADGNAVFAGNKGGQNEPTPAVGLTALPFDPFSTFLENSDNNIRVVGTTALPSGNMHSVKQTEWTYALMMNISQSLGVNCTFCHNSRSFVDWSESNPPRVTAWYGIRMVRDLNKDYLEPLASTLPPARHGQDGDGPKVGCATCHKGVHKPLLGAKMLVNYAAELGAPTLLPPGTQAPVTEPAPAEPAPATDTPMSGP